MKICIFSRPFYPAVGGLEQIAKTLAHEFSFRKNNVEVVTDTLIKVSEKNEFPFKITRTSSFKERFNAFRRADIVLFMNFTFTGVPIAILACRSIVLSHHGIYNSRQTLRIRLTEFLKSQATRFFLNISVSHFVDNNIPGKSVVVPNAYDDDLFQYTSTQRTKDFVFCGRLVSDKGANIILDALKIVLNDYPMATLTIIGDGPERNTLQKKSEYYGFLENINFTGILRNKELINKLKEHSCMIIPSLWEEPFGIVALEGLASCDTVISSNRGGLPEAVGDCGILLEPTVKYFSDAMIAVLQAKEKNISLPGQPSIEQRKAHLAKHTPDKVAQRYLDVFRQKIK